MPASKDRKEPKLTNPAKNPLEPPAVADPASPNPLERTESLHNLGEDSGAVIDLEQERRDRSAENRTENRPERRKEAPALGVEKPGKNQSEAV